MHTRVRNALTFLAIPLVTLLAACDANPPSVAVEGSEDSMTMYIVDCSDQGIVELAVVDSDSQDLWRIRSDEPIPNWEIEYGVAPAGFEVLQQPRSLAGVGSILIDTVRITGRAMSCPHGTTTFWIDFDSTRFM